MSTFFCGYYVKTLYKNLKNGYTIFAIHSEDNVKRDVNGNTICVGYIADYIPYTPLKINANIQNNNGKYRYNVISISEYCLNEKITTLFLSKLCDGIGNSLACRITDAIGANIFEFAKLNNACSLLKDKLPNIDNDLIINLIAKVRQYSDERNIIEYFLKYNGSYNCAKKAYKLYGDNAINRINNNPYKAYSDGIMPFQIAENIAFSKNIPDYNDDRIRALIYEAILWSIKQGNTYTTLNGLYNNCKAIINESPYKEIPSKYFLIAYLNQPWIVIENEKIYLKIKYEQEMDAAKEIIRLLNSSSKLNYTDEIRQKLIKSVNYKLAPEQEKSLDVLKSSGIKIFVGGPGTGKTTITNLFIKGYKMMYPMNKIALASPTGRAAQRMKETTGCSASTIHKLLEYQPFENDNFNCKNSNNQLEESLIIIDEASMIDIKLLGMLLSAIKSGSLVIFVGDENQLESVGDGNVLHDLINTNMIEVFKLNQIFRQDENSVICVNEEKILKNDINLIDGKDFKIIKSNSTDCTTEYINKITKEFLKQNISEYQILTTNHKYKNGTDDINKNIQQLYYNKNNKFVVYGKNTFYENDKIIFINNNYDFGFFNGDIGTIIKIVGNTLHIKLFDRVIKISDNLLDEMELAYAITIHKAQGSECDYIIMVLPISPINMLNKNLLYTGITRAKKMVYLIYESNSLKIAINNIYKKTRKTYLTERIKEYGKI